MATETFAKVTAHPKRVQAVFRSLGERWPHASFTRLNLALTLREYAPSGSPRGLRHAEGVVSCQRLRATLDFQPTSLSAHQPTSGLPDQWEKSTQAPEAPKLSPAGEKSPECWHQASGNGKPGKRAGPAVPSGLDAPDPPVAGAHKRTTKTPLGKRPRATSPQSPAEAARTRVRLAGGRGVQGPRRPRVLPFNPNSKL
ncbi:hypothetical protein NDU88_001725 [Pleurodeles waltl]|uniref:Uncharacterized protein n=1 Tax=Pleurodeles waltl TaxID=8319 RepID=A0AAV7W142_PLEWA|nr:hypothetical protein NDU88_001725 [Pleurodeles waltl]